MHSNLSVLSYQHLSVRGPHLGAALLASALLQDCLSLRADSAALAGQTLGTFGAFVCEIVLLEIRRFGDHV